jgi:malate dehydrogenase (oxaloacetate-decarboxylating)
MDYSQKSIEKHKSKQGKIGTSLLFDINNKEDLSIAYTPGIAAISQEIVKDYRKKYELTSIGRTVAVVSNGTAVLGLGNIGAEAAFPVMEGKAALLKRFANIDSQAICIDEKDPQKLMEIIKYISINYAGINLEDIKSPECFMIEQMLDEELDIPVFHDDQHGTAIVVGAAIINALKVVQKDVNEIKVAIAGAGAAGIAIAKQLKMMGVKEIIVVDTKGILTRDRVYDGIETEKRFVSEYNVNNVSGGLSEAINGSDIIIGVSKPGLFTKEHIKSMNTKPIIFALSNPIPEIFPQEAKEAGAEIIATGRSDYPNQINNVLAFPGIFKGAIEGKAKVITKEMKYAASLALAEMVDNPTAEKIIVGPFEEGLHEKVAEAVKNAINEEDRRN